MYARQKPYSGGKLRPSEAIFDMLEKVGIVVPKEDRFYPYISMFDYEKRRQQNSWT